MCFCFQLFWMQEAVIISIAITTLLVKNGIKEDFLFLHLLLKMFRCFNQSLE